MEDPKSSKPDSKPGGLCNSGIGSLAHMVSKLLISSSMRMRVGLLVCKVFFL